MRCAFLMLNSRVLIVAFPKSEYRAIPHVLKSRTLKNSEDSTLRIPEIIFNTAKTSSNFQQGSSACNFNTAFIALVGSTLGMVFFPNVHMKSFPTKVWMRFCDNSIFPVGEVSMRQYEARISQFYALQSDSDIPNLASFVYNWTIALTRRMVNFRTM